MFFQEYKTILDTAEPHLLLDVRPLVEVDICHLPFSLSILSVTESAPLYHDADTSAHIHLDSQFPCNHPPYTLTRHSPLEFRGEEQRTYPVTPGEDRPVEAADGR